MANVYSRGLLYSDGSGIETGVAFDPTYRLGKDDQSYVEIKGVGCEGGEIHVRVDHLEHLIEWLKDVRSADWQYRHAVAEGIKAAAKEAKK